MLPASAIRVAEAIEGHTWLASEIKTWIAEMSAAGVAGAHTTQLATLDAALSPTVEAIGGELQRAVDGGLDLGGAYAAARLTERRAIFCRRLFQWYATRFEQRRGRGATPGAAQDDDASDDIQLCLAAADEVVWSTWARTFTAAGIARPPAPLPFIDNDAVPWASFHNALPGDAQPPSVDPFFKRRIRELPVAVIGLPPMVVRRPWWLVVAIHETGHHVQQMLGDDLVGATAKALTEAATAAGATPAEAQQWADWSGELFADAFAAVFAGDASVWAIEELERGHPADLVRARPTYPPAVIRLQLASMAVVATGCTAPEVTLTDPATPVDLARVETLALRSEPILRALLALPLGQTTLGELAGDARARSEAQTRWALGFAGPTDPEPVLKVEAAAECVAGAVTAWRTVVEAEIGADPEPLKGRVLRVLPKCRASGVRAAAALVEPAAQLIEALLDPEAPL